MIAVNFKGVIVFARVESWCWGQVFALFLAGITLLPFRVVLVTTATHVKALLREARGQAASSKVLALDLKDSLHIRFLAI